MLFNLDKDKWERKYHLLGQQGGYTVGTVCPICHSFSTLEWRYGIGFNTNNDNPFSGPVEVTVVSAKCLACSETSYWLTSTDSDLFPERLIYPKENIDEVPSPNPDMPEDIKQIYNEARNVLNDSSRASAALSRLAIDQLTKQLEPEGNTTLNDRIGKLVQKGLSPKVQKSLDAVRVIGNNGIHPGEIDLSDNKNMAISLLKLINIIADSLITQPKQIDEMYNNLPTGAINAIEKRDSKNQ